MLSTIHHRFAFILTLILIIGCGCGDGEEERKGGVASKKACRLSVGATALKQGQSLEYTVTKVDEEKTILSQILTIDGVEVSGEKFPTNDLALGKHRLNLEMTFSDSTSCTSYKNFFIHSDIEPILFTYRKVNTYPHDPASFTQGLEFVGEKLYEGTGQYGESYIRRYTPSKQDFENLVTLTPSYFGEGITIMGDRLYQLTYKENTGFEYDLETMEVLREWTFENEGWGLTNDGTHLIMTDGSERLTFFDPTTLKKVKELYAYTDKGALTQINELEYVDGSIYANLYGQAGLAQIEATSGKVLAIIDCSGIVEKGQTNADMDVMNGIAFKKSSGTFFLTGKYWPNMYEVQFLPKGK